jgi:hypothetical protein
MTLILLLACVPPEATVPPAARPWEAATLYRSGLSYALADGPAVWAVGWDGRVVEGGAAWSDVGGVDLDVVFDAAAGGGERWALTTDTLARWDGGWREEPLPSGAGGSGGLLARADGSVVVLRAHMDCDDCDGEVVTNGLSTWDGAAWTVTTPPPNAAYLYALAELPDGTLVAVGSGGTVAVWEGEGWTFAGTGGDAALIDVAATADGIVAVAEDGTVVRGPLDALVVESVDAGGLTAVAVADDGAIWALGAAGVWVDDGTGWVAVPLPAGAWADLVVTVDGVVVVGDHAGPTVISGDTSGFASAWHADSVDAGTVAVDAAGAAWIVGPEAVARWDDAGVTVWPADLPGVFHAAVGDGAEDLVVVGNETIATWDGVAWSEVVTGENVQLSSVSVASDGAAFAVGAATSDAEVVTPVFWRRTDGVWAAETAPIPTTADQLIAVQAFAQDDVYALSWRSPAQLLHWDGAAWSVVVEDLGEDYEVMWGRDGSDLYLGRGHPDGGTSLARWDGATLSAVAGAPFAVEGLAGTDAGLLVSGTDGYGDAFAPVTFTYADGVWTELLRADERMLIAAGGGAEVVLAGGEGWRRAE